MAVGEMFKENISHSSPVVKFTPDLLQLESWFSGIVVLKCTINSFSRSLYLNQLTVKFYFRIIREMSLMTTRSTISGLAHGKPTASCAF